MLVDCDAVRVRGTVSAVPQLNTPDWEPPPPERSHLTHETDIYKYALFVLRCLSPGPNASTARDPRRADDVLDARGQGLLRDSLSTERSRRPPASEWADYFADRLALSGPPAASGAAPGGGDGGPSPSTAGPTTAPESGGQAWTRTASGAWQRSPR